MSLDGIQSSYIDKTNVEFSGRVASLQVSSHVDVVVADDARDEV